MPKERVPLLMLFLGLIVLGTVAAAFADSSRNGRGTGPRDKKGAGMRVEGEDLFRYVGCWRDDSNRTLSGLSGSSANFMTNRACREYCRERGFDFSGTQYHNLCFCGNSYERLGQAPEPECNTPCDGNKTEMCGGLWRNSVFTLRQGISAGEPDPVEGGRPESSGSEAITGDGRINLALNRPAKQSSWYDPSRVNDSQGAVDGVKNGGLGFHTAQEQDPWWQVDLGARYALDKVRIFNRMDCCGERSRTLQILLSDDSNSWRSVYQHTGSPFGGTDGHPLLVSLKGEAARFIRLQLREKNYLHLDEVEVYGYDAVAEQVAECVNVLLSTGPSPAALLAEYKRQSTQAGQKVVPMTETGIESWLKDACTVRCMQELGVRDENQ